MPERSLMAAVGDTATVVLPSDFNGVVTAILNAANGAVAPVGAAAVVELSADDGTTWEIATLNRPDKSTVAALAISQSGWCEAPSYTRARIRLTALTSGTVNARINFSRG